MFGLVGMQHYIQLYKTLNFDIGMCPVAPTVFNAGKSNLKMIEYMSLGVLPVVSDYVTYNENYHKSFLASPNDELGWIRALRQSVNCEDAKERTIANRKFVEENFDIAKTYKMWERFYQEVLEG